MLALDAKLSAALAWCALKGKLQTRISKLCVWAGHQPSKPGQTSLCMLAPECIAPRSGESPPSVCGVFPMCMHTMCGSVLGSRYLEKVMPGPYGPQLPWWFPLSSLYWRTGDVEDAFGPALAVQRWCGAAARRLRWRRRQPGTAYRQVRC